MERMIYHATIFRLYTGRHSIVLRCMFFSPLKCFGQQTNSTPLKREMPQGSSMAKDLSCRPRSWQAPAAVAFQRPKVQQLLWLWMWSKRQFSGTRRASDWNGPSRSKKKQRCIVPCFTKYKLKRIEKENFVSWVVEEYCYYIVYIVL